MKVTVRLVNETILLRVTNTMAQDRAAGADGIGLKNVRERMAVQFEGRAALMARAFTAANGSAKSPCPAIRESPPVAREAPAGGKLQTTTLLGT